jgi:4-diphosphocytidyl-2-C-methyl-D-erythritol kinase
MAKEDSLTCSDPRIPIDSSNLVWKAAKAFRAYTDKDCPVAIHIDKKIPIEAGLGGGSSNAATTLWALNELTGRPLSTLQLMVLGAQVGSDVPFFFSWGTAYCTGRGEMVKDVELPMRLSCVLVKPPYGLSTPRVFGALDLASLPARDPEVSLREALEGNLEYYNDLEGAALAVEPRLATLQQQLVSKGFTSVVMTGSGSSLCCYGPGDPPAGVVDVSGINRPADLWW